MLFFVVNFAHCSSFTKSLIISINFPFFDEYLRIHKRTHTYERVIFSIVYKSVCMQNLLYLYNVIVIIVCCLLPICKIFKWIFCQIKKNEIRCVFRLCFWRLKCSGCKKLSTSMHLFVRYCLCAYFTCCASVFWHFSARSNTNSPAKRYEVFGLQLFSH